MAVQSEPRPELAHSRAMRVGFDEVARALREILGARLVAYLGSVKETRAVHQWAEGARQPGEGTRIRLRLALQIALMVASADGPDVARAWFSGLDPALEDRSPARLLREGEIEEVGPQLLGAARAFLALG